MNFAKNLHMKNKSIILKKFSTPDESSVRLFPKIKNSFSNEEFLEKYSKYFDVGEKIFSQFSLLPKKEERNLFHWIHFGSPWLMGGVFINSPKFPTLLHASANIGDLYLLTRYIPSLHPRFQNLQSYYLLDRYLLVYYAGNSPDTSQIVP